MPFSIPAITLAATSSGVDFGSRQAGRHPGVDVAGVYADDQRALRTEFEPAALVSDHAADLRGAIRALHRRVEPARDRQDVDQRAAAIAPEHRRERAAHRERAEIVRLHLAARVVDRRRTEQWSERRNARVVDQDRRRHRQRSAAAATCFAVGDVEPHRLDDAVTRHAVRASCCGIDLGATGRSKRSHERLPLNHDLRLSPARPILGRSCKLHF